MSLAQSEGLRRYFASRTPEQKAAHAANAKLAWERKRDAELKVDTVAPSEPVFDRSRETLEAFERARQRVEREKALLRSDAPLTVLELRGVGAAVRSRRSRRLWSQEAFASRVGVEAWSVDLLERGRYQFGHKLLAQLAAILSCSTADLLLRGSGDIRGMSPAISSDSATRSDLRR